MHQWQKSSPEMVDVFHQAVAGIDGLEVRKMFGYPAGFIGGNLTASLHQDSLVLRLPQAEGQERLEDGWQQFEPMPGRPMRGYVTVPASVAAADPAEARRWVERAADYVRTLPPKALKPKR